MRLIGDEHNPANVIIEMSGTLVWKAKGGFCEGITFRRPKLGSSDSTKKALLRLESGSRIDMLESVLDNDGGNDHVVVGKNCTGVWKNVILRNGVAGLVLDDSGYLNLKGVSLIVLFMLVSEYLSCAVTHIWRLPAVLHSQQSKRHCLHMLW